MPGPGIDVALRLAIDDLYAAYCACLDHGRYEEWPDFFVDDCIYKVQPRENFDRGLPLATLSFESKGMLKDRVYAVTQTLFHAPYYQRHIISGVRVTGRDDEHIHTEANYLVLRTKLSQPSEVYSCGRYIDTLTFVDGVLKFRAKITVFDSELIANSMIYPI
jgi:salicylate 5-hydroxylase small subunit